MKLRFAAAAALATLGIGYGVGIGGLDGPLSLLVSRRSGLGIRLEGTRLERFTRIRFERAFIADASGRPLAKAGRGALRLRGASRVDGHVESLSLAKSALERLPSVARDASIGPVDLVLRSRGRRQTLHVSASGSDRVWALGGITLQGGAPIKAHGWLFAADTAERVPEALENRLYRKGDMRGLRFLMTGSTLTAFGHAGPFFEMRWSG